MKEPAGQITRIWLTMIHVSDMDRVLKFYHETLGLPIALVAKMFNHAEVGPKEPLRALHTGGEKSSRKRHTGIVFDTDDIYTLYDRLRTQGVRLTRIPTTTPWGGIVADFLDPDNNESEVVQDPEHYERKYTH